MVKRITIFVAMILIPACSNQQVQSMVSGSGHRSEGEASGLELSITSSTKPGAAGAAQTATDENTSKSSANFKDCVEGPVKVVGYTCPGEVGTHPLTDAIAKLCVEGPAKILANSYQCPGEIGTHPWTDAKAAPLCVEGPAQLIGQCPGEVGTFPL